MKDSKEDEVKPLQRAVTSNDFNLPRIAGPIPIACLLAYYGGSSPFQNYIQLGNSTLDAYPQGGLDHGTSLATLWNNYFSLIAYSSPLLGAFIADQYYGKFRTIIAFAIFYAAGWFFLFATSIPSYDQYGSPVYSSFAYPGYIIAITVIGLGTGGIKSLVSPMCADQVPKEDYIVSKNGVEYIIDPDLTVQSVFNWFYWSINIGAAIGQIACTKLERGAYWKAYLLPAAVFILAITIFAVGYKYYIHIKPESSIYVDSIRVISFANKEKKKLDGHSFQIDPKVNFKFLEYAKVKNFPSLKDDPSVSWSDSFVEELQQTLKACSIFPFMIIYWVAYSQMTSNLVSQAAEMNVPTYVTNDLINIFDPIVLVLLIPVFDRIIYPYLTKHNIQFGYIRRITLGIVLGGLSMIYAAVIQVLIYQDPAFSSGYTPSTISVFWQLPAYGLIAVSEIFASIGSLEYSYTHAPKSMKGLVAALSLFPNAVANAIGIALSPLAADPLFTVIYIGAGAACLLEAAIFYYFYYRFDVEDMQLKLAHAEIRDRAITEGNFRSESQDVARVEAEAEERLKIV